MLNKAARGAPDAVAKPDAAAFLDRIELSTESLARLVHQPARKEAGELLSLRERLVSALVREPIGLDPYQLPRLEALLARGEAVLQSLLIEREVARAELQERRSERHARESFRAAAPSSRFTVRI